LAHTNDLFDAEQVVAIMWLQGQGEVMPLR
jgi:hypothetical protein